MNALNQIQIANEVVINTSDFAEQTLLILDALDLAAVGGGADVVVG
jgi:hypothetical protein